MKLEKWREAKDFFTDKLSEVNRKLSFVGIAVIWLFKMEVADKYSIPNELFKPIFLFVLSLGIDFLQYFYGSTVWTLFFKYHENQKRKNPKQPKYVNDDIKAPKVLPNLSYIFFFYPKLIVNIFGYIYLITYLINALMG